jgi:hypothetical protein
MGEFSTYNLPSKLEAHQGAEHWELWDPTMKMAAWAIIPGPLDDPMSQKVAEEIAVRWNAAKKKKS